MLKKFIFSISFMMKIENAEEEHETFFISQFSDMGAAYDEFRATMVAGEEEIGDVISFSLVGAAIEKEKEQ